MSSAELTAPPLATSVALPVLTNLAWVLAGNVVFAMCQWGIVVALAKAGSTAMVGQFSLGIAIATPILMFSNCDLRAVQATDATREFQFHEYLRLRTITTALAFVAICGIAWFGGYARQTAWIIGAVGVAKAIESFSDVHYGLFQLSGRLDQTGRSMMLRGTVAVTAMVATLLITGDVLRGCLAIATVWLAVLCMFDIPHARKISPDITHPRCTAQRIWDLVRIAIPMGIVTTLASVNLQIPRYFVHAEMGDRSLGIFSALAYATVAMTLIGDSLGQCVVPRLARLFALGQNKAFAAHLAKLVLAGIAVGAGGVGIAALFGFRLLNGFYSAEYAIHVDVFVLLTLGAAIHFVASMLTSAITASRRFGIQVPMYVAMAACTALACARWIPTLGLEGAALAVISGAVVRLTAAAGVVWCLCGGQL